MVFFSIYGYLMIKAYVLLEAFMRWTMYSYEIVLAKSLVTNVTLDQGVFISSVLYNLKNMEIYD